MKKEIKLEKYYPYPINKVWRAMTDKRAMSQWLMECDFEPVVGHKFQFLDKPRFGWDGIVNCEVLEIIEPQKIVYSWNGGSGKNTINTIVTWTLEKQDQGTLVKLNHTGFTGISGVMTSFILKSGWEKIINRLLKNLRNTK